MSRSKSNDKEKKRESGLPGGGAGRSYLAQSWLRAGFDTRAHRFTELLKDAAVIEIDYGATQEYKKRRVEAALGGAPANVRRAIPSI